MMELTPDPIDFPMGLPNQIKMDKPNDSHTIFNGEFDISLGEEKITVEGKIYLSWLPSIRVKFIGHSNVSSKKIIYDCFISEKRGWGILKGKELSGKTHISNVTHNHGEKEVKVVGEIFELKVGKVKERLDKLSFVIPNLGSFGGSPIKYRNNGVDNYHAGGRISLVSNGFSIIIDQVSDFKPKLEELKSKGGYMVLHNAEINFEQEVEYESAQDLLFALSIFLSFLNGRRVGPMIIKNEYKGEFKWEEYPLFINDNYRESSNWAFGAIGENRLNDLWSKFWVLWSEPANKDFLVYAIKWYCEANATEISTDTRLIMAQTTLELIFNWWLVEVNKMILGKDSRNLSASNKIRLILSSLPLKKDVPECLEKLKKYMRSISTGPNDGPESIVLVRNAFVHAHESNRDKIKKIGEYARGEVVNLAVWYIELALLKILEYDGRHHSIDRLLVWVPWHD